MELFAKNFTEQAGDAYHLIKKFLKLFVLMNCEF